MIRQKRMLVMSPLKEYLYIYYGRIPDRKDPPYEYIELVRGTSDYTPQTVEKSFYAHNRVEMGKFAMTQGDVLVWFEGGWPVVVLVGDTAFERREPTAVQCRELVGIWLDYVTDELNRLGRLPFEP